MDALLIKIALVVAVLGAAYWGEQHIEGIGYARAMAEYQRAIDQQKTDAAQLLATETAKTRLTEQALQTQKNQQEVQDAQHQKTVVDLSERLRVMAGPAGRLRDPHATAGCGPGGGSTTGQTATPAADRADDNTQTSGFLSTELTQFLFEQAADADQLNNAYIACRADSLNIRAKGY